jgi:hypothetical protein
MTEGMENIGSVMDTLSTVAGWLPATRPLKPVFEGVGAAAEGAKIIDYI